MKTLSIPKQIVLNKYESIDGKVFDYENECIDYEDKLFYKNFIFNESLVKGKISNENWRHYVYAFMHKFLTNPDSRYKMLQERNYLSKKKKKDVFSLEMVMLNVFKNAYVNIPYYDENINKKQGYQKNWGITLRREFVGDIKIEDWFKFIFSSGLMNMKTVELLYGDKITGAKRVEFDKYLFRLCYNYNSTEALDIVIKYLKLDIMSFIEDKTRHCSGMRVFKYDFITAISSEPIGEGFNYLDTIDDAKRIKWLEYFIKKDLPIKLYKFNTMMTVDSGGTTTMTDGKERLIQYTVADLIEYVKYKRDNCYVFIFKKSCDKIISILENAGPKFINANIDNRKPPVYKLVEDVYLKLRELFSDYPEVIIHWDDVLFDISRVIKENKPGRYADYRTASEINVDFYLETLNRYKDKKTNVCVVSYVSIDGYYYKHSKVVKVEYDLNKFVDNHMNLVKELSHHLNLEQPFVTLGDEVKDIDMQLFSIEKQKEALAAQEKILFELKDQKMSELPKKKK